MTGQPPLQETERSVPLREAHLSIVTPVRGLSWRQAFVLLAGAVLEIAKALHRLADALERDRP